MFVKLEFANNNRNDYDFNRYVFELFLKKIDIDQNNICFDI